MYTPWIILFILCHPILYIALLAIEIYYIFPKTNYNREALTLCKVPLIIIIWNWVALLVVLIRTIYVVIKLMIAKKEQNVNE